MFTVRFHLLYICVVLIFSQTIKNVRAISPESKKTNFTNLYLTMGKSNITFGRNKSNFTSASVKSNFTYGLINRPYKLGIKKTNSTKTLDAIFVNFDLFRKRVISTFVFNLTQLDKTLKAVSEELFDIGAIWLFLGYKLIKFLQHTNYNICAVWLYFEELKISNAFYEINDQKDLDSFFNKGIKRSLCNLTQSLSSTSKPEYVRLLDVMKFYVSPLFALFALCQNVLFIAILKFEVAKKTSNILLLAIVTAGSFQLFLSINFADIILYKIYREHRQENEYGCIQYSHTGLQIFKHVFIFIGTWGQFVFSSLTMLITTERLLAVFFPLRLKTLVTRKTVSCGVLGIFALWLPWTTLKTFCFYFFNIHLFSAHEILKRDFLLTLYLFERELGAFILNKGLPIFISIIGNIAIAVRIKLVLARRNRMTFDNRRATWSARTTKTLLLTCSVLSFSEVLYFSFSYISLRWMSDMQTGLTLQSEFINLGYILSTCFTLLTVVFTDR
ncbi:G-protein coupled receptor, partial [Biomphalaria pfeifferi]